MVSRRARWGWVALGLMLGIGFWQRPEPAPKEVRLAAPIRLASAAFDSVGALRVSDDGRFVALETQTSSGPVWKGKAFITLFSRAQKREIARIAMSDEESDFAWDAQGRLWIARGNGWDVWQTPWKTGSRVEARVPLPVWKANNKRMFAFEPNTETVALSSSDSDGTLQLWRRGREVVEAQVPTSQTESGLLINACVWSPDGTRVAISLGRWVGIEREGVHEIWLLDIASSQLRRVAQGQVEGWVMADRSTQNTDPAWSRDGKTLVWGDQEFGVSQTDVSTSSERRIFGPKWGGQNPAPSPSGRALAFTRRARFNGAGNATLVVAALDASWWARGPKLSINERWTWNPARDELLFLAPGSSGAEALWSWNVAR